MSSLPSPIDSRSPNGETEADDQYRAVLKLVLEGLVTAAPAGSAAIEQLKSLESVITASSGRLDLGRIHTAVTESLLVLREDVARAREAARSKAASGASSRLDFATGLPGPAAAQQKIAERISGGKATFAAVMVLDQLRTLNARFGRTVGDEILQLAAEDLSREVGVFGTVYRWRGPAFLVISSSGKLQADALQDQIRQLGVKRLEKTITVESRSIHVKITFSWDLQEVNLGQPAEVAIRRFDDFVASKAGAAEP